MRLCSKCKQERPMNEFVKGNNPDGLYSYCSACRVSYTQSWRSRNAERHKAKQTEMRLRGRAYLDAAKNAPCIDCGGRFPPCAMDFDHVRGVKLAGVGALVQATKERLDAEIAKCDLVCANCHRIRTHARKYQRKTA